MPRLKRTPIIPKPVEKYTYGRSVPNGGRQAVYNPNKNTYDREFIGKGFLISQGIGNITGVEVEYNRAFSVAFSPAFS